MWFARLLPAPQAKQPAEHPPEVDWFEIYHPSVNEFHGRRREEQCAERRRSVTNAFSHQRPEQHNAGQRKRDRYQARGPLFFAKESKHSREHERKQRWMVRVITGGRNWQWSQIPQGNAARGAQAGAERVVGRLRPPRAVEINNRSPRACEIME